MPSHSDNGNQGSKQGSPVPSSLPLSQQQQQCHVNPSQQNTQRVMIQQKQRLMNADEVQPNHSIASSPQENILGNEGLMPSSSGQVPIQRQISGVSMHNVGSQWQQPLQQQQSQQLLQQQQQQQQPQHHNRTVVQSNIYAQPSNSGPG
uniref:Uncharacterized protein n=1 Tax=Ananas comosus var. bracteatus TaxID=296719 RepID=A0A6V7PD58_ANACO|nr:unnamed protein product [Ananas comosus var. bracteatus]